MTRGFNTEVENTYGNAELETYITALQSSGR